MKKDKIIIWGLGLWTLLLCGIIAFNILNDINSNNQNDNQVIEKDFYFNSTVGDFKNDDQNDKVVKDDNNVNKANVSYETNKDEKLASNKDSLAYFKEKEVLEDNFGSILYNEITYQIKNGEKIKVKAEKVVDSTNYHATVADLKKIALDIVKNNEDIYKEIVDYTNNYRLEVGLDNLEMNYDLNILATIRAIEMAYTDLFSHTRIDGSNCTNLANNLNIFYKKMGENIAHGYNSGLLVTKGWRDSVNHYKNMINSDFKKIGIGLFKFNNNNYWVQIFTD